MRSLRTIVLAALAAAALTLALAACGSSKKGASASGSSGTPAGVIDPQTESLTGGKRGGVLNDLQNEDFEHLDPGQSYFQLDYAIQSATQRYLYSYKPNNFTEATPDIAEGQPQLSNGD